MDAGEDLWATSRIEQRRELSSCAICTPHDCIAVSTWPFQPRFLFAVCNIIWFFD